MRVRPVFIADVVGLSLLLWAAHLATLEQTPIHGHDGSFLPDLNMEYCHGPSLKDPKASVSPAFIDNFRVAPDDDPMCVRILASTGALLSRQCSAYPFCPNGMPTFLVCPYSPGFSISIYSRPTGNCSDGVDMLVDEDGHRLDDGPDERILWRLGWSGQFLLLVSATLTISPLFQAARRRWKRKAPPPPAKPRRPAVAFVLRWLPAAGLFVAAANILRAL